MQFSTKLFSYNKESKGFIAEAYDLCSIRENPFHRIYSDSCDEGITLVSERTGVAADYVIYRTEFSDNEDRELLYWTLHPTPSTVRKCPQLRGSYVTIFND